VVVEQDRPRHNGDRAIAVARGRVDRRSGIVVAHAAAGSDEASIGSEEQGSVCGCHRHPPRPTTCANTVPRHLPRSSRRGRCHPGQSVQARAPYFERPVQAGGGVTWRLAAVATPRRIWMPPAILAAVVTLANALKPLVIDDTAYVAFARQIAA